MSTVAITIAEPGGSPVDYTNSCVFARCSFDQQMNAVPGSFNITLRDPERVLFFVTGSEIVLTVDGVTTFGGYVTQISMTHFAPAADTADLDNYDLRTWILRGVDYNCIFDRRVWRNTGDYFHAIDLSAFTDDGAILRELVDNYADLGDFDSSGIEDIATIDGGDVVQQGEALRKEFTSLQFFSAAVWYINPAKTFIYTPYDNVEKRWGFSDIPNHNAITDSPASYQGATTGFREVEGVEDGSYMANDALIWGGSQFAGSGGGTVFARSEDSTSEALYGRWQHAETHFGERKFSIQAQVDAVADAVIEGPPGTDATGQQKGLKYPQWQFTFTWFSDDVPLLDGTPDHIIPGDLVTIDMEVFGVTKLLPVRTLRTTFPDALPDAENDPNDRVVQFDGTFGLQIDDPFTLWAFVLRNESRVQVITQTVVTDTSPSTTYGAYFSGTPTPTPDGVATVFAIPFGYIIGTTQVYLIVSGSGGGLLLPRGVAYTESDNIAGEVTLAVPPATGDALYIICQTLER